MSTTIRLSQEAHVFKPRDSVFGRGQELIQYHQAKHKWEIDDRRKKQPARGQVRSTNRQFCSEAKEGTPKRESANRIDQPGMGSQHWNDTDGHQNNRR